MSPREIIKRHLRAEGLTPAEVAEVKFYTPKAWRDRGETYGRDSKLVVLHEGGNSRVLSMTGAYNYGNGGSECYDAYERLVEKLRENGYWIEEMYSWASAVYAN